MIQASTEKEQMSFYIAQQQIDTEEVEILWECASEEQAIDECDRINSSLAGYGIPGNYWAFVL
jgi:hypothetical protein